MKTFKLVIAGGGSTYTPGIVKSLLVQKDRFKLNELVLYDNNAERQEAVGVIVRHVVEMFDPELKLTLTTDPEVAMTDADFRKRPTPILTLPLLRSVRAAWKCGRRTRRSRWSLALWVRRPAALAVWLTACVLSTPWWS